MARVMIPEMSFVYDQSHPIGTNNERRNRTILDSLDSAFQSDIKGTIASQVDENTYLDRTVLLSLDSYESSGLLLTPDGWIATNAHCIMHVLPKWYATIESYKNGDATKIHPGFLIDASKYSVTIKNMEYPIDIRYFAVDMGHDLALIKARGSSLCTRVIFPWKESRQELITKPKNYSQVKIDDGIRLYSRKNNVRSRAVGKITNLSTCPTDNGQKIEDMLESDCYVMFGYSGGVVTSSDWQILGLTASMLPEISDSQIGKVGISKADYLVKLINSYVKCAGRIIDVEVRKDMATLPHIAFVLYET